MQRFYRLNYQIQAEKVRVLDEEGKQLGIMSLDEALKRAKEEEVDLVEIVPRAVPPVCRLIDFKKFKYELAKKEQQERKHARDVELKEVRMGPFVAEHDFNVRLERIKEFLQSGNKVKVNVKFSGREMSHPEFGHKLLSRILEILGEIAQVEREAKFEGRNLNIIIGSKYAKSKN